MIKNELYIKLFKYMKDGGPGSGRKPEGKSRLPQGNNTAGRMSGYGYPRSQPKSSQNINHSQTKSLYNIYTNSNKYSDEERLSAIRSGLENLRDYLDENPDDISEDILNTISAAHEDLEYGNGLVSNEVAQSMDLLSQIYDNGGVNNLKLNPKATYQKAGAVKASSLYSQPVDPMGRFNTRSSHKISY